ncbi:uncharacterized protein LOC108459296 [Gossypium arboreum]|uniref:uncharacterized protein LOC108459296 n=1 Tax=Gossypium arboreum TaxID=29729 RepID=UPI000818FE16|nr:uncharacterized protein LOC108459296 [Gossypium arboreum]
MSSNQARVKTEEAESAAQASVQRATSSGSRRPVSEGGSEAAKATFFELMDEWFSEYLRTNPTEVEMCKQFEEWLNEDIKLLIGILKLREFVVLAKRAHKAEELNKEKRQAEIEAWVTSKRFMNKMQSYASKKSKNYHEHFATSREYSGKERSSKRTNPWSLSPLTTCVGSVGNPKPRCNVYNKLHFRECRMRNGACFKCGSLDHFLKDCPERVEKEIDQTPKSSNPISRGRPPQYFKNFRGSRSSTKDSTAKFEARALARTYAIRVREDASAPDVITGAFSLFDTDIIL